MKWFFFLTLKNKESEFYLNLTALNAKLQKYRRKNNKSSYKILLNIMLHNILEDYFWEKWKRSSAFCKTNCTASLHCRTNPLLKGFAEEKKLFLCRRKVFGCKINFLQTNSCNFVIFYCFWCGWTFEKVIFALNGKKRKIHVVQLNISESRIWKSFYDAPRSEFQAFFVNVNEYKKKLCVIYAEIWMRFFSCFVAV